ncbi:MAG: Ig-like domain-containing protein [Ginsengibacter sp.]
MKQKSYPSKGILRRKSCSKPREFKWLSIILLLIFAAGCKKVNEVQGTKGICPTVVSTTPVTGATNVVTNTKVTATFNEAMDPLTINTTTFVLKQGSVQVAGTVTYTGMTATFTPANLLVANTVYTGTITAGSKDLAGNAMIADYVWTFNTGNIPTVISTDPINGASGVAFNKLITATFSTAMDPGTINSASYVLKQGATIVLGAVTYSGNTATFTPTVPLAASTVYTGLITTAAKDVAGNALALNYTWSFSTGAVPTVISTDPVDGATGVALNKILTANFSSAMDPLTVNGTSFLLKQGVSTIAGTVSYTGVTATFTPTIALSANMLYTATITTAAKNVSGNALANNYVWSFTTTGVPIPPPLLGSAAFFGVFGGNAGITNQGLNTVINNGGIGTTAASSLITGFHDGLTGDVYTETPLNKGNVTGGIFTAPPAPGTATSFAKASQGLIDATNAYNSISPASKPGGTDPGAGELGGLTLAPGTYQSASGTFKITNGNLTLDAMGDPNAVWIFQTAAGLTVGIAGPAGARSVVMINGGLPKNVYWYVGSAATINAAGGGIMSGTIISKAGITFSTPGNAVQTVLNGRAISLVASVTMVNTTINVQ